MARLPLKKLELSYLELGWLMGILAPHRERMKKEVPALRLRMDILATKAYINVDEQKANDDIATMKKELLKITKTTKQTFQPSAKYLSDLRKALGEEE